MMSANQAAIADRAMDQIEMEDENKVKGIMDQ